MFDLKHFLFVQVGNLITPVSSISATATKDKILVFGGETNDRTDTHAIQCFDTLTHTTRYTLSYWLPWGSIIFP